MTAKILTLDTETIPVQNAGIMEEIRRESDAATPAQNTRREIKEQWDGEVGRETRFQERWAKTAVDVLLAAPVCVSWCVDDGPVRSLRIMPWTARKERAAAQRLSKMWAEATDTGTLWVAHCALRFDLPLLLNWWRRTAVIPPAHFPGWRMGRWRGNVWDSMLETPCHNGLNLVSLADACRGLGLPDAKSVLWDGSPMDGSRVWAAYQAADYKVLEAYCRADVAATRQLYRRQTFGGVYPGGRLDQLAAQLEEIDGSGLSSAQVALAKLRVLETAGLVPRT